MAVDQSYLVARPAPPSTVKRLLDQQVIPAAVNLAGAMETALVRGSRRSGLPVPVILGGLAAMCLLPLARRAWRRG